MSASKTENFKLRKSEERGFADHGWLKSYHTFSFANYYEPNYNGFRSLRVINEDRVAGGKGFGKHPHSDFEIFSYVVSGALEHKDSLGNLEVLNRGDVQFTSAGTGIYHSEYNHSPTEMVHFIQIWVKPAATGLKPRYSTKHFSDEDKKNKLKLIISPEAEDASIQINQDVKMFACLLEKDQKVQHKLGTRFGYIHVVQLGGSLDVNGIKLGSGDGVFVQNESALEITGTKDGVTEFLLFDLS
eukprot:TRINITY_DN8214_c0_g1_i1.p1 TRINITY_DN8214_c0_g1~~TRINITY_DN8214_c0_g1_i1.p1  ORF type:complete len:258 (-),score=54.94 TRINITY_DN8214_c0_g1_i1:38-766(-)